MTQEKTSVTRRIFLQRSGGAVVATTALSVLGIACGGGEEAGLTCDDVSGLTPAELSARESNGYVANSPHGAAKQCINCNFGQNLTESSCGTCTVIKGAIHPEGYCNLWAAKA